jgi:hypothetical protein
MIPPDTGALQCPQREDKITFLRARPLVGAAACATRIQVQ